MIEFQNEASGPAVIRVIGVGGAGGNAVNNMIDAGVRGVEFIAVNTDVQDLAKCKAPEKIAIGSTLTGGLGAGSDPQKGQQAANEDREKLQSIVEGADMIFITAGLGGGTGTGAAPVIAELAKNSDTLTVAVVTKPFQHEGRVRSAQAEDGIKELKNFVDSLIVIPNQKLLEVIDRNTTIIQAFCLANDVLRHGVQSISDLITGVGYMNVDFADVEKVMSNSGSALMGIGLDAGDNRAQRATEKAITNPLVEESSIQGATGVLVNIAGSEGLGMLEVDEVLGPINDSVDPGATIIFGIVIDPELNDKMKVTVIATGFDSSHREDTIIGAEALGELPNMLNREFGRRPNPVRVRKPQTRANMSNIITNSDNIENDLEIPAYLRVMKKMRA